jgi:hypothetical protein
MLWVYKRDEQVATKLKSEYSMVLLVIDNTERDI